MPFRKFLPLLVFILLAGGVRGQENPSVVGIAEQLDRVVPLDAAFLDESGQTVTLRSLAGKPTILTLVYFRCPSVCSPFLNGVADVAGKLDLRPGEEYQIVTISFDSRETPELARQKKENYLKLMPSGFPPSAWRFLTGDTEAVRAVTAATGWQYKRDGDDFLHPVAMIVLSPEGKITRYLYGMEFLPFDVKLAIFEAGQGRSGSSVKRALLYCFSYDPDSKRYVFNLLKVSGTLILCLLVLFAITLVFFAKRRKKEN